MKRGSLLVSLAFAVGCDVAPRGVPPAFVVQTGRDGSIGLDASLCAHAQAGCACDGEPPIDCYLEPSVTNGTTTCHAGTRYCRGGVWTGCQSIEHYTLVNTGAELLTGPDPCNPCDPRCFAFVDTPTAADLTPSTSSDAEYDPRRGGIRPRSTMPITPPLPDSDGDGVPDVADDCPGMGAFLAADGSCYGSTFFYHSLAMGGPVEIDSAPIEIQIRSADVYFLMDTTGSMGGELTRLSADLTSGTFLAGCSGGIIGAVRCTIPDAYFGVGFHDDYPYGGYGSPADIVYRNTQDITSSVSAAQAAVNALGIHGGDDGPESQIPALWSIATGLGLGVYSPARAGCPPGTTGYPCFRAGAIPIVIHITDAPYHNGPSSAYPYSFGMSAGAGYVPTFAETAAALMSAGVRVITVQTCGNWSNSYCLQGEQHAKALGSASGSLGASGLPYVLRGHSDGSGLSATIVSAVQDLASYSTMDISARTSGDTQGFTESIVAISWGPGTCTGISGGSTFLDCLPGTTVGFDVAFRNSAVASTSTPQVFSFFIEVVGDGTAVLDRIPVRIVVPALVPVFAPSATYWHDYDSTTRCLVDERPDWGALGWSVDLPTGTGVQIDLRSADALAALPAATPIATVLVTSTGAGSADASALLRSVGALSALRYLRAFVTLDSSADLTAAPVLETLTLEYTCVPSE